MAATETIQIDLGYQAPELNLPDTVSGNNYSFSDLKSDQATVVMFICNHCPFVVHVLPELIRLGNDYKAKGISFIAISSNDVENYPDDAPDKMGMLARQKAFPFPYLYDETQEVAKAYEAACTPDFSIFDGAGKCVYRGQLDSSRPGNNLPLNGADIRAALDAILAGEPVSADQRPSIGCNIKWKK